MCISTWKVGGMDIKCVVGMLGKKNTSHVLRFFSGESVQPTKSMVTKRHDLGWLVECIRWVVPLPIVLVAIIGNLKV